MVIEVLNRNIKDRGIPVSELARRTSLDPELLRRSLAGQRRLRADEFVRLCLELKLDTKDFVADVPQGQAMAEA